MISFAKKPSFAKTLGRLNKAETIKPQGALQDAGTRGVSALSSATPVLTTEASRSWGFNIKATKNRYVLTWTNSDMAGGVPLVILLQYGHATKDGRFLSGRDFINPALKPVKVGFREHMRREIFR